MKVEQNFYEMWQKILQLQYNDVPMKHVVPIHYDWFHPIPGHETCTFPDTRVIEVHQGHRYRKCDILMLHKMFIMSLYLGNCMKNN